MRSSLPLLLATALVATLLAAALPWQWPRRQTVSIGSEAAAAYLSGFSFPETAPDGTTFRWSEGEASVTFANMGNAPLALHLRLHARRPDAPPPVTILANGTPVATFPGPGDFEEQRFTIPRADAGRDGRVTVTLRVPAFSVPPDTRALGAAVAWASIESAGWPVLPPQPLLTPLLLAALAAPLWRVRRWLAVAVVALPALAASTLVALGMAPMGAWLWLLPTAAWLVVLAAWAPPGLAGLRRWAGGRSVSFWLVAIAAAALALYLPLARTTGYWGDIEIYMAWTHQVVHHGIHSAYAPGFVAPPNTTPVLLYPFWAAGELFRRLWSPAFPPPWIDRTNQEYLRFLLRMPALLATGAIAATLALYARRRWGTRVALVLAAAYLFNPAVVFESAYYGQMGGVHSLFMLLAVLALVEGRPAWCWAALTLGVLTKPQADVFVPLLLLLTWRQYGWRGLARSAVAALAVAAVVLAPFLYYGTLGQMWERVSKVTSYHPVLSATAHNLWWLASLGWGRASDLGTFPFLANLGLYWLNFRLMGLALFGLAYLLVLAWAWRAGVSRRLYAASAYLFLAFFILPTQIHENHLIPMFPLLLLAAVEDRRLRPLYVLYAVAATVNMALHYPDILRTIVPANPDIWGGAELALPRWLDSGVHVAGFAWWTWLFARETLALWRGRGNGTQMTLISER